MASRRLQPADDLLVPAVAATVEALCTAPEDAAAVRLVQRYAAAIDGAVDRAEAMEKLGPKLLAGLESLGATPAARARLKTGGAPVVSSGIAAIRQARRSG